MLLSMIRDENDSLMVPIASIPSAATLAALSGLGMAAWARATRRAALPHGINTVALFALRTGAYDATLRSPGATPRDAYAVCVFCTFFLGLLQVIAAASGLAAELRARVPRPALLAAIGGVALSFIATNSAMLVLEGGEAGLAPFAVMIIGWGAKERMPGGVPVGVAALAVGALAVWLGGRPSPGLSLPSGAEVATGLEDYPLEALWRGMRRPESWKKIFTLVCPLVLVNLVNDLACLEAARDAGDDYDDRGALAYDGVCSLVGSLVLGCPVPTCLYVGHAGFKALGAGWSYPAWNALMLALVVGLSRTERGHDALSAVPKVAVVGFLVWIGSLVASDAFRTKRYGVAVVVGMIPAFAAWRNSALEGEQRSEVGGDGYLLLGMMLASAVARALDKAYGEAGAWFLACAASVGVGIVEGGSTRGFLSASIVFGLAHVWVTRVRADEDDERSERATEEPRPRGESAAASPRAGYGAVSSGSPLRGEA